MAKVCGAWNIVRYCPTTVDVDFEAAGKWDQTQFDLYSSEPEKELTDLWESMYKEFGTDLNGITEIYAYGYICE